MPPAPAAFLCYPALASPERDASDDGFCDAAEAWSRGPISSGKRSAAMLPRRDRLGALIPLRGGIAAPERASRTGPCLGILLVRAVDVWGPFTCKITSFEE